MRDPEDPLLQSTAWTSEQLVTMGRLAEVSARLELLARFMLTQAVVPPSLAQSQIGEALFLGERFSSLQRRLEALSKIAIMPAWVLAAAAWAKSAARAIEKRDQLLHRPSMRVVVDGDLQPALGVARLKQTHEFFELQARQALESLVEHEGEGWALYMAVAGQQP